MAEPVSRAEHLATLIKHGSLIVSLMLLISTVNSMDFGYNLDMYKESFMAMFEHASGYMKQRQNRIENISRLLKEAQSITDEEQLEIFMEDLQDVVNEAYEHKIEDKYRIIAAEHQFNLKVLELYPKIQKFKMSDEGESPVLHLSEELIKTYRTFLGLKKKLLAAEDNGARKRLIEVLNVLKKYHSEQHDEL